MQDNPVSGLKKRNDTCGATSLLSSCPYLCSQQMRVWHYCVLGGSAYLISGPFYRLIPDGCNLAHFMDEWQRFWCKSASSHMCTAQRLVFTIRRFTHLSPGSRPQFYEATHYQPSIHFPQEDAGLWMGSEPEQLQRYWSCLIPKRLLTLSTSDCESLPAVTLFWIIWVGSTDQSWSYCKLHYVHTVACFPRIFQRVWPLRVLAELCQMSTNTSGVKYSLAVILAFLPSFWICHGGCTQGWLSV